MKNEPEQNIHQFYEAISLCPWLNLSIWGANVAYQRTDPSIIISVASKLGTPRAYLNRLFLIELCDFEFIGNF